MNPTRRSGVATVNYCRAYLGVNLSEEIYDLLYKAGRFATIEAEQLEEARMRLWAVYRQDSRGGRFTVGVNGVFSTDSSGPIRVWDLESEAAALEAAGLIEASHYHHHKADYFAISYSAGRMHEMFKEKNIQIMGV